MGHTNLEHAAITLHNAGLWSVLQMVFKCAASDRPMHAFDDVDPDTKFDEQVGALFDMGWITNPTYNPAYLVPSDRAHECFALQNSYGGFCVEPRDAQDMDVTLTMAP